LRDQIALIVDADLIDETFKRFKSALGIEDVVKPILGFTHREIVMLDLDDTSFKSAKYWALKDMKRFNLGGFVILRSSKSHYHLVFDRYVSREDNLSVIAWVAVLSGKYELLKYLAMQCIKKSSTLRVGMKGDKPSPRVVYRHGNQSHAVKEFLRERQLIKRIGKVVS
jgi:hypothetical protein